MNLSDIFAAIFAIFKKSPISQSEQPAAVEPAPISIPPIVVTERSTAPVAEKPMQPIITSPQQFISAVSEAAQTCCRKSNVPASVTIAQAALESGWGKSCPGFNLFGIKADASWTGATTSFITHEVENGKSVQITAAFRAYPDWQGSIDDHAAFLTGNPRYKPAFAFKDGPSFAQAIAKAGYATDPQYAQKLISIMNAHDLQAFDNVG